MISCMISYYEISREILCVGFRRSSDDDNPKFSLRCFCNSVRRFTLPALWFFFWHVGVWYLPIRNWDFIRGVWNGDLIDSNPFAATIAATTGSIGRVCGSITRRGEGMGSLKRGRAVPHWQRQRFRQGYRRPWPLRQTAQTSLSWSSRRRLAGSVLCSRDWGVSRAEVPPASPGLLPTSQRTLPLRKCGHAGRRHDDIIYDIVYMIS